MPRFTVTMREEVEAKDAYAAAVEIDRLLHTGRPLVVSVALPTGGAIFVKVERGDAQRIA
jgi:hypothetical protein